MLTTTCARCNGPITLTREMMTELLECGGQPEQVVHGECPTTETNEDGLREYAFEVRVTRDHVPDPIFDAAFSQDALPDGIIGAFRTAVRALTLEDAVDEMVAQVNGKFELVRKHAALSEAEAP